MCGFNDLGWECKNRFPIDLRCFCAPEKQCLQKSLEFWHCLSYLVGALGSKWNAKIPIEICIVIIRLNPQESYEGVDSDLNISKLYNNSLYS